MSRYVLGRVVQAAFTVLLASVLVFALARVLPGDPARLVLGEDASPSAVEHLRAELGLDRPLPFQYWSWMGAALRLDFGDSIRFRAPVATVIGNAFPPTVTLLAFAMVFGVVVGVTLGAIAGIRRGRVADLVITAATSTIIGVPSFWFGVMAILVFALWLGWLPPGGWVSPTEDLLASLRHMAMPALTMGLLLASILARFTRASVVEALASPYITTARSKGLSEKRIVLSHALRNALIPVLTVLGIQVAGLLGGQVFIEQVFAVPGMGRLAVGGIAARDFPLIQGILMLLVVIFIIVNLIVDLLYGVVDPRVRARTRK